MQFSKNTSATNNRFSLSLLIKVIIILAITLSVVVMLDKIEFPSPNKKIEKSIPNEKLKIIK